jgi:Pro-kumamolisin, activation domain/Bacterial Ig-like domain (group 3)
MRSVLGIAPILLLATLCSAAQPDRIATTIDTNQMVVLAGNVHGLAQAKHDQGRADAGMKLEYITMQMQPSARQQAGLNQLLQQQQDPSSPNFHKWLTPEQYADRFGLSQNDVEKVKVWLRSEGFAIVQVARGRDWIAFSGTAALVENAFQTEIHYYNVDGVMHHANATPLSIPKALSGVVIGFRGLHDFSLKPMGIGKAALSDAFSPVIAHPFYNLSGSNQLAPGDIATIYNINPLYSAGIDGTGMKMVVVGQVDVSASLSDIENFRSAFGLSKNDPKQTIVPGSPNPGTDPGDMGESKLDLEWAGAVAPNATILFITASPTPSVGGVFTAAQYAIDQNLAPVISMSYGGCESINGGFIPSNEVEMQKANTEGITFLASSGDTGAAGCDSATAKATMGLAVNYPASSPEVTGVGGNEFNEGSGTYWSATNGTNGGTAISYIPEMAWNDTLSHGTLSASGGGASSCDNAGCTTGFPKPSWQTGTGVQGDKVRDVPDVAMSASPDHDGYIICDSKSCASGIGGNPMIVGGTSASTPVFAGIVTLLNQFVGGTGLGNINPKLYQLAQTPSNGVFHDVTTGSNMVPCQSSPPSPNCPTKAPFQFGYSAGKGYDRVTGLGSVDAHALATNFSNSSTTTTVSAIPNPASFGTTVTFTATVTTKGSSAPTGTVTFNDGATALGTGTIAAGMASLTTSTLSVGAHSITAAYGGDTKNAPSTSTAITQTITASAGLATTTAVVTNPSTVLSGTSVTLTATVTPSASSAPTGTVTFRDGIATLGQGTLNGSGVATLATTSLTAPTAYSITAVYGGDANYAGSTSSATTVTVNAATFTFSASPASQSISSGASASYTLTVTPSGTYTNQVSFSCAFSPSSSATCTASPVTPNASPAMTTLTIAGAQPAVVRAANTGAHGLPPLYGFWMPMGVAGLFLLGGGKKSKLEPLRRFLPAGALLVVAVTLFGCGGSSSPNNTPPPTAQTYQVTITATAPATASGSSAAVNTTQTVSLTVNP